MCIFVRLKRSPYPGITLFFAVFSPFSRKKVKKTSKNNENSTNSSKIRSKASKNHYKLEKNVNKAFIREKIFLPHLDSKPRALARDTALSVVLRARGREFESRRGRKIFSLIKVFSILFFNFINYFSMLLS